MRKTERKIRAGSNILRQSQYTGLLQQEYFLQVIGFSIEPCLAEIFFMQQLLVLLLEKRSGKHVFPDVTIVSPWTEFLEPSPSIKIMRYWKALFTTA